MELTIEQRFALTRARYEVSRMSRGALEKVTLKILRSRMEQKNGIQETLAASGILFKVDEINEGLPEIISEETFIDLISMSTDEDTMPRDIDDVGFEDDDLDDDNVMYF